MRRFSPYSMDGGTTAAIAGNDFAIAASDTRLCDAGTYAIHTREHPHVYKLCESYVIASTGFNGDVNQLIKELHHAHKMYKYDMNKEMSLNAMACLLHTRLYRRRFFPLYTENVLVGLDDTGKGAVYIYDSIGSYELCSYGTGGSSSSIVQTFFDAQIRADHVNRDTGKLDVDKEASLDLVKDVFISAAERDIYCGDGLHIVIITKAGIEEMSFPLRRD